MDSSINTKKFRTDYEYRVKNLEEKTEVLFTFEFIDDKGNTGKDLIELIVVPQDTALIESSGHQFFSKNSGEHDGYNLVKGEPLFTIAADSSNIDVTDTSTTDSLSRVWISPAGGKFVRFEGFDYANATNKTLIISYNSGKKYEFLPKIKEGDVILYHRKDINFYAAIKLIIIREKKGAEDDSYIFSIKR